MGVELAVFRAVPDACCRSLLPSIVNDAEQPGELTYENRAPGLECLMRLSEKLKSIAAGSLASLAPLYEPGGEKSVLQ